MLWMLAKVIFMTLIPKVECPHVSVLEQQTTLPIQLVQRRQLTPSIQHLHRPIQQIYKRKHIHIQRDATHLPYLPPYGNVLIIG
jgi:hypothetical protein